MCYLIHLGVPTRQADSVPPGRVPRIDPQRNASVSEAFGAGFAQFSVTDGGCSCSLYSEPRDVGDRTAEKRKKYERMGWSRAKIERALADSAGSGEQARGHGGLREDIALLVAGFAERYGEVRLLIHAYRGSFIEERVTTLGTQTIEVAHLRAGGSAELLADTLYVIRP